MSARLAKPGVAGYATRGDRAAGGVFYFSAGAILGVIALLIDGMIDAIPFVIGQRALGRDICMDGFPAYMVPVIMTFGVVSSFAVGRWLFGLRRSVGDKPEPGAEPWSAMIRRRFAWGSMSVFCAGTLVNWFLLFVSSYCGGGERLGA